MKIPKTLNLSVVTALAITTLGLTTGSAALASTTSDAANTSARSIEGRMLPDCGSLTDSEREYARLHDIEVCGVVGIHDDGSASFVPANQVSGDCGSSASYLQRSRVSPTQVTFEWGFHSTVGNMIIRDLMVTWKYGSTSGSKEDYNIMNSATYNGSMNKTFADKSTHAQLLGMAITDWGLDCYLAGPTATLPA